MDRQIIVITRWSYSSSKYSKSRNIPNEARRILIGPIATGEKYYPSPLHDKVLSTLLEPRDFALIKPKEHVRGRGRVSAAEGAVMIYGVKRGCSEKDLIGAVKKLNEFCKRWKNEGIYGIKIRSYEITTSRTIVYGY